jgi:hypothetical protein
VCLSCDCVVRAKMCRNYGGTALALRVLEKRKREREMAQRLFRLSVVFSGLSFGHFGLINYAMLLLCSLTMNLSTEYDTLEPVRHLF